MLSALPAELPLDAVLTRTTSHHPGDRPADAAALRAAPAALAGPAAGQADDLAQALAEALLRDGGWYADFEVGDDHVVVFAGRVFRYERRDIAGRDAAVAYGRAAGVPEHQLDWGD